MSPALRAAGAGDMLLRFEPDLTEAPRELSVRRNRPNTQDPSLPQRMVRRAKSSMGIEPVIGRTGQTVRPVVDIEEDGVEGAVLIANHVGHVRFM